MEAFNFTVANEDCCLYTYDMRKLAGASCVHKVRHALRVRARVCARVRGRVWQRVHACMRPCV